MTARSNRRRNHPLEVARIYTLSDYYARIVPQSPVELVATYIYGNYAQSAPLQQAVCETACRGPHIKAVETINRNFEFL